VGKIPIIPEAVALSKDGYLPAGSYLNKKFFSPQVEMDNYVPQELGDLFYDAQTSGGLLVAVSSSRADAFIEDLRGRGVEAAVRIGEVKEFDGTSMRFVL
jgi:selenide,water dikinase